MALLTRLGAGRDGGREEMASHVVGNALVVHPQSELRAEVYDFALFLAKDPDHELVVLDLPPGSPYVLWESAARQMPHRRRGMRLVIGGHSRETTVLAAQWLSERLGRPVIAPDGAVIAGVGGTLFVDSGRGSGWVRFQPGRRPRRVAKRFPLPSWESAQLAEMVRVGADGVAEPLPGGMWLHAQAPESLLDEHWAWLAANLPCRPAVCTLVLGCPGAAPLSLEDVVAFWRCLPEPLRPRLRVVRFGPVSVPVSSVPASSGPVSSGPASAGSGSSGSVPAGPAPSGSDPAVAGEDPAGVDYGQALADLLGEPVACYAGIPVGSPAEPVIYAVRADGSLGWKTFPHEIRYLPLAGRQLAPLPQEVVPVLLDAPAGATGRAMAAIEPARVARVVEIERAREVAAAPLPMAGTVDAPPVPDAAVVSPAETVSPSFPAESAGVAGPVSPAPALSSTSLTSAGPVDPASPAGSPAPAGPAGAAAPGRPAGSVGTAPQPAALRLESSPFPDDDFFGAAPPARPQSPPPTLAPPSPLPTASPPPAMPGADGPQPPGPPQPPARPAEPLVTQHDPPADPDIQADPAVPAAEPSPARTGSTVTSPGEPLQGGALPADVMLQPTPSSSAAALLPKRGLDEERGWLRRTLHSEYSAMANSVSRVLSEHPGFQGALQRSSGQVLTDAVAVRLYLSAAGDRMDLPLRLAQVGPHVPFARCVVSGLSRLPSHRGATVSTMTLRPTEWELYRSRKFVTEWGFVNALTAPCAGQRGEVDVLVWSMTARRTKLLEPEVEPTVDRVLFVPGTSFKVLEMTEPAAGGRGRILLRELAAGEIDSSGRVDGNRVPLDELAINSLRRCRETWAEAETKVRIPDSAAQRFQTLPGLVRPVSS